VQRVALIADRHRNHDRLHGAGEVVPGKPTALVASGMLHPASAGLRRSPQSRPGRLYQGSQAVGSPQHLPGQQHARPTRCDVACCNQRCTAQQVGGRPACSAGRADAHDRVVAVGPMCQRSACLHARTRLLALPASAELLWFYTPQPIKPRNARTFETTKRITIVCGVRRLQAARRS
jgi:hypothetical protein